MRRKKNLHFSGNGFTEHETNIHTFSRTYHSRCRSEEIAKAFVSSLKGVIKVTPDFCKKYTIWRTGRRPEKSISPINGDLLTNNNCKKFSNPVISFQHSTNVKTFLLFLFFSCLIKLAIGDASKSSMESENWIQTKKKVHMNQLAVKIEGGRQEDADSIAKKYGFRNMGPIIEGGDFFLFESRVAKRHSLRKKRHNFGLNKDLNVLWVEQQVAKRRVKRDFNRINPRNRVQKNAERFKHQAESDHNGYPVIQHDYDELYYPNSDRENSIYFNQIYGRIEDEARFQHLPTYRGRQQYSTRNRKRISGPPNDPFWTDMWYLHRSDEQKGELDHNVREAWALGYTGRGIVVTILDDGLERTHPDIAPNYDPEASYDVNDRDEDPTPRYEYTDENRHGTRCAGEVAAIFNNSLCVVGIAFNSRIGGIRMLDGDVTDAVEAQSLSYNSKHIDIYSASWGPDDDGRTVDGPATLTKAAFERGINEGRGGKGSIFIWASGNGGKDADSCNCDGYTNSIHTLSISSATERGNIPWYSEACSSTLATAYSSGATGEKMIVTTDLHHSCTKSHTGTSASAPLAAGIAALTLEANPELGWRDLQHIVARTARPINLRAGDWKLNGVGRNVSHSFGYGLLDAGAMVRLARIWHNVPKQKRCKASYPNPYKIIPRGNRLHLQLYTDGCSEKRESQVKYIEHVQAIVSLNAPKRGDIQIYLTSPRGTRSTLLAKRQRDTSRTGFREWAFMTTHNWGESSYGTWSLEIDNDSYDDAELQKWDLILYGTDVFIGPNGYEPTSVAERSVSESADYEDPKITSHSPTLRQNLMSPFLFFHFLAFLLFCHR